MKILVTGCAGFLGQYVVHQLLAEGHAVVGVDSLEPRVHRHIPRLPDALDFHHTHVANVPYYAYVDADAVIHLAAQVGVADSMTDPLRYVRENTLETASFLLDLERAHHIKRIVVASSMSVYGEGGVGVKEDAPCVPMSVYGQTKYDQERLVRMWGAQHDAVAIALRFFNVYGPGQALHNPYTGVLANFANWLLKDQRPIIYGDGSQTRDWVYAADVARAVCHAATSDAPAGTYNVCTGMATTLLAATAMLTASLGKNLRPCVTHEQRPGDILHCSGDPTLARDVLGWHATTTLAEGLSRYADGLKENR
jgi:dTDP-L-rhamnose 4-epimerase